MNTADLNQSSRESTAFDATDHSSHDPAHAGGIRPAMAANDDHVGVVLASPGVADVHGDAANDNSVPDGPRPDGMAKLAPPRHDGWSQQDPRVIAVVRGLEAARVGLDGAVLQTVDYLLRCARSDGRVSGHNGVATYRAISAASGVGLGHFHTGRPARLMLDAWLPGFDVASVPGMRSARSPNTGLRARIERYCDDLEAGGLTMPAMSNGAQVSLCAVAEAIGVDYERLLGCSEACRMLREAVSSGRVALSPVPRASKRRTPSENRARIAELMAVVSSFDVPGGKVPESPLHVGAPDYDRIAELTGTPTPTLKSHVGYRAMVREVVARRGTMPPGLEGCSDTFASLRAWGCEQVEREQKEKGSVSWAAVVANHRSALDRFMAALGFEPEDDVADAFGAGFDSNLATASADVGTSASTANFVRLATRWRELRLRRLAAADLPERFGPALGRVIAMRGITASALAREVGCDHHTICDWVSEQLGVTTGRIPLIGRVEAALGLTPGTLLSKVASFRVNYGPIEGARPEYLALGADVRGLLPKGAAFWPVPQLEAAVAKVSPLLGTGTAHGELCSLARDESSMYAPFDPCDRLRAQVEAFIRYKTVEVPYPLLRASQAQWMSDATVEIGRRALESIFRFAVTPLADGPFSGLGLDPALGTMAWLAVPTIVFAYTGAQAKRFADMEWKGERRGTFYTAQHVDFLSMCVSLTNPATGWLAQHPELADTLVPLVGEVPARFDDLLQLYSEDGARPLLTEAEAVEARRDWVAWCGRAHNHFVQAKERVGTIARVSRNPYESISGLIDADEPIPEYLALLYAAERTWASERTNPSMYRIDVRDAAMARLAPITGFRPRNLSGLVYTGDERGEIRKLDGVWEIEVDYRKFKNWRSCRLFSTRTAPRNFRMRLRDECGLYEVLDTWFLHARNYMAVGEGLASAFVAKRGTPMTTRDYNDALHAFGMRHVAWNPVLETGFPGVTSLNPYQVRHIRATDTLKRSRALNRVEEAAFAIQTSEQMIVGHYGFLVPEQAILDGYETFSVGAREVWKRFQS